MFIYFKTKDKMLEYFSGDRIECLICGKKFLSLGSHILYKHNMTVMEYKDKFNLPSCKSLCAKSTKDKMSKSLKKRLNYMMPISAVAKLGQYAKKRNRRDYEIDRFKKEGELLAEKRRIETETHANKILDIMEEERISVAEICSKYDLRAFHLTTACIKNKKILDKYNRIRKNKIRLIEKKTNKSKKELVNQVDKLKKQSIGTRQIAVQLGIGRTTIRRIIAREGGWGDFYKER